LFIILAIPSCTFNDLVLDETAFEINLSNYIDSNWSEGTLYVGAKNIQGDFIATDSMKYIPVPSNISPNNSYSSGEIYDSSGEYKGYHYYRKNGIQYVKIPYPLSTHGSLFIDKGKIAEISQTLGFVFKLSDGQKKYIDGYNIHTGFDAPNGQNRLYLKFDIKTIGIIGEITTNGY
jgi:hypothetical protein